MKSPYLILIILAFSAVFFSTSAQTIKQTSNNTFYPGAFTALNEGLYYTANQFAFNLTSNVVYPSIAIQNCIYDTPQLNQFTGDVWCTNTWAQTPVINLLSADLTTILATYPIPIGSNMQSYSFQYKQYSGQYAILHLSQNMLQYWQIYVFDTVARETICSVNITTDYFYDEVHGWFDGTNLYYLVYIVNSNNLVYNVTNCNGQSSSYTGQANPGYWVSGMNAFNNSSVYTVIYEGSGLQAVEFPSDSDTATYSSTVNSAVFTQINDTSFYAYLQNENNFGIWTIDENFNYILQQGYNNIPIAYYSTSFILGSSQINLQLNGVSGLYDFASNEISYLNSQFPPITLMNGNQVLLSNQGYYIITPSGKVTTYYNTNTYIVTSLYQNLTNPSVSYVLFISSVLQINCQLIQINALTSQVNVVINNTCNSILNSRGTTLLLDVGVENGNYFALYGNTFFSTFYVVTSQGLYPGLIPIVNSSAAAVTANPALGIYYSVNIYLNTFVGAIQHLNNGTFVSKKVIPGGSASNAVCKVSETYFLLVNSSLKSTSIFVWDAVNLAIVQVIQTDVQDLITDCFVIGSTLQNSNQFSYGILISETTIYAVDGSGNSISTSYFGTFVQGIQLSSSSILVQFEDQFISQVVYEISDGEMRDIEKEI